MRMTEQLMPLEELQENQEIAQKMKALVAKANGGKIPREKLGFVDGGRFRSVVGPHLEGRLEASMNGIAMDDFGDMPEDFRGSVYSLCVTCIDTAPYFATPDGNNKSYILGSNGHIYFYYSYSFYFTEQGQASQSIFIQDLTDEYQAGITVPEILDDIDIREEDIAPLNYIPEPLGEPSSINKEDKERIKEILNKLEEGYFNIDPPEFIGTNNG